jgi:hypothetical protein
MAALMPVLLGDTPAAESVAVHPLAERALGRLRRWFPGL